MVNCNESRVVKFIESYCERAHQICANIRLAPKLYYVDHKIPAGYQMVVMEYLPGFSLDQKIDAVRDNKEIVLAVYNDVVAAIEQLHVNGYVFADLRPPNIMVIEMNNGKYGAMLVDLIGVEKQKAISVIQRFHSVK